MQLNGEKQDLLERLHAGYKHFRLIIGDLTPLQLQTPGVVGHWSLKDLIAHFIAHEQFALRELVAARQGEHYSRVCQVVCVNGAISVRLGSDLQSEWRAG